MLRDILNRILWDQRLDPRKYTLSYIHRGVEGDKITIPVNIISNINRWGFTYLENSIPYHRILTIKCGDQIIYEKRVVKNET
jgi:uncharacterized protein (UPF0248 family)